MGIHSIMKKATVAGLATITAALLSASNAFAQSSGNFTATITQAECVMNTLPGQPTSGGFTGGRPSGSVLDTYIKTPNGSGTTLLITPSLVTGLFTNTAVTQDMQSSAVSAAVRVNVTLDGQQVAPVTSPNGIIYDQRFQQLSANTFDQLMTCSITNNCSIDLVESTLAAHSFNFVAPNVPVGNHHLQVTWTFDCTDNTGAHMSCANVYTTNTAGACAGPGSVTVTQVKNFSQDAPILITTP
jgi:hypothetical protein